MDGVYRIYILPEASADLNGIFEHIERNSPQSAISMIQQLLDAIDSLERFAYRNRVHISRKKPSRIVYAMVVSSYIVYYRMRKEEGVVEVMTVRHGARNQPKQFK